MKKTGCILLACAALAVDCSAVETRFWQQTDQADFEKGTLINLSLRSDGRLFLAPEFREVFDPSTPYLWALLSDGNGKLYAGGGGSGSGTAKLFVVDSQGKGKTLCELEGLEIHALARGLDGNIYAATDPDGKVYKVTPDGKSSVFFDPKEKYIWALAFNRKGELFIATGDQGNIFKVGPDGKGALFFKTEETHARSLAIDSNDNLIAGTEPGGLVIRVSPEGKGFVLFQMPKREVTAVAVDSTGQIYAAAAGNRSSSAPSVAAPAPVVPPPTAPGTAAMAISAGAAQRASQSAGASATPGPAITGGSEVYRISADNSPRRLWSNSQDIVYGIGFDGSGRPLIATGNRGYIYRLDGSNLSTLLITASPTQITSFASAPGGRLFVATGNIGRIYEFGPGTTPKGSFESEVLDAGSFTYWGRLSFRGTPRDVTIATRSGNLNRPSDNWSSWAPLQPERENESSSVCQRCLNGRVTSPSARFLQVKIDLRSAASAPVPEVASIEVAYLNKNVAPIVEEVEVTPPNYRFPAASTPSGPSTTLSLPPLGQKKRTSANVSLDLSSSQTLTFAKGMMGVRWAASDENGDALSSRVEIRGAGESAWKLLKDNVRDKYLSFDSSAFPDGEYQIRVTSSDLPGNTPSDALSASLESDPFLIDNTPPQILGLSAAPGGGRIEVRWRARDRGSIIDHAEYSVNGGEWIAVEPKSKLSDSPEEEYQLSLEKPGPGEMTIAVRVTDSYDNQAVDKTVVK